MAIIQSFNKIAILSSLLVLWGYSLLTHADITTQKTESQIQQSLEATAQSIDNPETIPTLSAPQMAWSYQQTIHPHLKRVVKFLGSKIEEGLANIKKIELYKTNEVNPVQTIQALNTKTWFDGEQLNFKFEDMNFDGYQDLRLMVDIAAGPIPYLCWLFEPKTGLLVKNEELSKLTSLEVDSNHKRIISYWKTNALRQGTNYYQFIAGKLTLIRQEITEYSAEEESSYQLTVLERIGNEMKLIEQQQVPAENETKNTLDMASSIKEMWQNLDKTKGNCIEETVPTNSAIRNFFCHIKKHFLDYDLLQQLADMPIFIKGPHSDKQLSLENEYQFGYYNKVFVTWLKDNFIPAAQDQTFRKATQVIFDNYVKSLARTFYLVHELLFDDLAYLKQEQATYLELIRTHQLPAHYFLKYKNFKGLTAKKFPEREVATAVAFWIRRMIDGTADEFFAGLKLLMMTYDANFALEHAHRSPKWTYQRPLYIQPPTLTFQLFNRTVKEPTATAEESAQIEKIEIYQNNDSYPFQTIQEPNMILLEEEDGLETEDMNFDGYRDLRIASTDSASFYWLFDPHQQLFIRNKELEQLEQIYGIPDLDDNLQQLRFIWQEGDDTDEDTGLHGVNYYQFVAGKLILVRQELYQLFGEVPEEDNIFEKLNNLGEFTIVTLLEKGELIDNEMKVIEQKLVPGNLIQEKFAPEEDEETKIVNPIPLKNNTLSVNKKINRKRKSPSVKLGNSVNLYNK
ncbi:hypothetical protein THII_2601 [Thioploca ingrica]|uniref:Uncharacterized protein n=1 Tax=Thioploca ingrica TaxID=40754 RepID=A0A090AFK0_9GAMM|nr:hypothetical protein THII_2601 [Thioploca ingrica]